MSEVDSGSASLLVTPDDDFSRERIEMATMTIDEMIEVLEDARDTTGGDKSVLLAVQPGWPMEYEAERIGVTKDGTVYIGQGMQLGYLQHAGAVAVKWSGEDATC